VRENRVKRTLAEGGVAIGTMITEFTTPGIARLAAGAGAEFALFDLEHTGHGIDRMRDVLAAARATELVPFLRVPDAAYDLIARGLDIGAMGLMVPAVESVDEARLVAESARFPPVGRRGFGLTFRDDWEPEGLPATLAKANAETLVLVQIETAPGLEAVEEIAEVEGVDVLWIGHFDLTASLGIPGEFESDTYRTALDRILSAGNASGKAVGMVCSTVEEGRRLIRQGFKLVAYSIDLWIYQDALSAGIEGIAEARTRRS
jgi:2-keto-3-deoxy-L-rhamnonate aldolase RhmA